MGWEVYCRSSPSAFMGMGNCGNTGQGILSFKKMPANTMEKKVLLLKRIAATVEDTKDIREYCLKLPRKEL